MTTKSGFQRPTIADVARQAGVSISTVSRVLNNTAPVANETIERVRQSIQDLNYRPQSAARVLASQKTNTIGLLLPEISGAFFSPLLRGVEAVVRESGFDLLINSTGELEEGYSPRRVLGEHNTDGLLIFIGSLDVQELVRFNTIGFPVILLHQTAPEGLNIPTVTIENKDGAIKIVEHLICAHNRRRIVFLQGPETHEDSTWRERGYIEALETHHIPFVPELVAYGGFDRETARGTIHYLLRTGTIFDAVFCGDDEAASGVLTALHEAGKGVPEEISVGGFDDILFAPYLTPSLTTVHAPTEQVGREAVRQLLSLISKGEADSLTLLPTYLVIRKSCGCQA